MDHILLSRAVGAERATAAGTLDEGTITIESLLREMVRREAVVRSPEPAVVVDKSHDLWLLRAALPSDHGLNIRIEENRALWQ